MLIPLFIFSSRFLFFALDPISYFFFLFTYVFFFQIFVSCYIVHFLSILFGYFFHIILPLFKCCVFLLVILPWVCFPSSLHFSSWFLLLGNRSVFPSSLLVFFFFIYSLLFPLCRFISPLFLPVQLCVCSSASPISLFKVILSLVLCGFLSPHILIFVILCHHLFIICTTVASAHLQFKVIFFCL